MSGRYKTLVIISSSIFFLGLSPAGYYTDSVILSTIIYIFAGALLVKADLRNEEPFYIGPGTIFWLGHFLCWVIGGYIMWYFGPSNFISDPIEKWRLTLAISSCGVGTFAAIYSIVKSYTSSVFPWSNINNNFRKKELIDNIILKFRWKNLKYLFIFVLVISVLRNSVSLGSFYEYTLSALYRFSSYIAYAFLGFAFFSGKVPRRYKLLSFLLVMTVVADSFVRGGRGPFLLGISAAGLGYVCRLLYKGGLPGPRVLAISGIILFGSIVYFQIAGQYRSARPGGTSIYQGNYSYGVMVDVLAESFSKRDFTQIRFYSNAIRNFGNRIYESNASELVYKLEHHKPNVERLFMDFVLQYVPPTIYEEKGMGRRTNLLQQVGIVGPNTGSPVTVPIDSYYRFGLIGVFAVYSLYALFLSLLSDFLLRSFKAISLFVYFILSILQVRMYTNDALGVFTFLTSDLVLITLLALILMYTAGIISIRQANPWSS